MLYQLLKNGTIGTIAHGRMPCNCGNILKCLVHGILCSFTVLQWHSSMAKQLQYWTAAFTQDCLKSSHWSAEASHCSPFSACRDKVTGKFLHRCNLHCGASACIALGCWEAKTFWNAVECPNRSIIGLSFSGWQLSPCFYRLVLVLLLLLMMMLM